MYNDNRCYEPSEEYVPATIKPIVDEKKLPKKPTAGGDELWLIQVPGDMDITDLDGLRFKLTGEGSGAELASMKAAGAFRVRSAAPSFLSLCNSFSPNRLACFHTLPSSLR